MYRRSRLFRELGDEDPGRQEVGESNGNLCGPPQRPCARHVFPRGEQSGNVRTGRLTRAHRCGRDGPGGLPKREGCQDRPQLESGLRRRGRICVTLPNSAMRARSSLPGQRHREGHRQCMEYPLVYISADREVDQPGLCMIPSAGGPLRCQRSRKAS